MNRLIALLLALALSGQVHAEPVMVGAAKVEVTPKEPVVLAGYGGRKTEFVGVDTKLWARAMVIGGNEPVAIVVLDSCGAPAAIKSRVAKRLANHGIDPGRLVVAVTHTHNAPNLIGYATVIWAGRVTPAQQERQENYTNYAVEQMAAAVIEAMKSREPMHLEWGQGRAFFGGNRRVLQNGKWAGFGFQRDQPVDHSLPVLVARDEGRVVRAVWANYACHCTTVGSRNHVGGDWAGFANEAMEKEFPGATSLMTIGCGADVGPQPGGNLQIASDHGQSIALEVRRLLGGEMTRLGGGPTVAGKVAKLPLVDPKPREHWEKLRAKGGFDGQLGLAMLRKLDAGGQVPSEVIYPVSSWRFGDDLARVFLPGEVVVDYSVRLNRELAWPRLWITAWANDMPGYIPSRRVLEEGGYEADFSQIYYEQPGRYKPEVEDVVVGVVREVVGKKFVAPPDQEPAPFHRLPSAEVAVFKQVAVWAAAPKKDREEAVFRKILDYAGSAGSAVERITRNDGEEAGWHNFAGDHVGRVFIRQQTMGAELAWESPVGTPVEGKPRVLCFTGGIGWITEPATKGFALHVDGEEKLEFDVSQSPARWASKDGSVELVYLPTWTSNVDSGGFFFIVLGENLLADEGRIKFAVRSLGARSKRWFAIDSMQEIAEKLPKLNAALHQKAK
ncbi:MAG: neutral/alkaline non-lysosomal ceramidase N-terminal domain-containing protein [Roseibacillus sp.]